MRPKSVALLLLALGCGLVASIGITEVLAKRNAGSEGTGETQPIFVAVTDIGLGDSLTPDLLKLEQWPKDKVPQGAISRIEDIEGRRARAKLYQGEPILENRLLGKGASAQGATALIPKGYRVVPVRVDAVSGGGSLILPGDRVDVMLHMVRDPGREIQETVTRTILQDIKVFAVDAIVDLEKDKDGNNKSISAKTISLLVTPEQAAKVMLATQLGIINLVMRSPEDDQQIPNAQARPGELFGTPPKTDRKDESLVARPDANLSDKTKSLLEFLNSMKQKAAQSSGGISKAPETWSMRILRPGTVEELQLEAEDAKTTSALPFGKWRTSTISGGSSGARPANEEPTMIAPPAQQPPPPPADEPQSPEKSSKNDKRVVD